MAVYALGDLHLPFGRDRSMEIFGDAWRDYTRRIERNWTRLVGPEDTVVVAGDLCWAMDLDEAEPDFRWLAALPGRKLLLKGNHDYYWTGLSKMRRFLAEKGIGGVDFLHNASVTADGLSLCGTRGWCPEAAEEGTVYARELGRLRASLAAAEYPDRRVCFLHYPPVGRGFDCPEIRAILSEFGVRRCYYGHLHGPSLGGAFRGEADGVRYECISADGADFTPRLVRD